MSDYMETRGLLTALWNELQQFKREQPREYLLTKRFNLYLVLPLIVADLFILYVLGYGWLGMTAAIVFAIAAAAIATPIFFRFFPYDPGADQQ
ncbi:hypothetical protein HF563_08245 [Acidithiobacillus ferridurans]|uniref:hypothetical protein n=1 Tax=Acidithiobacillus ferridurans TaxID=1232575 RepID=UPI001C075E9E|nr:hypothetical protein [Acidithiobacillus ferridurans]MBU2719363.1 hypothetical protein [Acidithiobacillus ferridurans]MBU2733473.1 hypothetical protein [Acidithiobacillus ferridurans]